VHAPIAHDSKSILVPVRVGDDIDCHIDAQRAGELQRLEVAPEGDAFAELSQAILVECVNADKDVRESDLLPELEDLVRSKNRNCRKDSEFSIPGVPRRFARARIFWKSIANRLAWGTNGLGAHPGLRLGDGGPRAAGADRISGRRKPDLEGSVEGAGLGGWRRGGPGRWHSP